MYLAGVSVRRVEDITEALWGTRVSPSTVSELNKKIYGTIKGSLAHVVVPCDVIVFPNRSVWVAAKAFRFQYPSNVLLMLVLGRSDRFAKFVISVPVRGPTIPTKSRSCPARARFAMWGETTAYIR